VLGQSGSLLDKTRQINAFDEALRVYLDDLAARTRDTSRMTHYRMTAGTAAAENDAGSAEVLLDEFRREAITRAVADALRVRVAERQRRLVERKQKLRDEIVALRNLPPSGLSGVTTDGEADAERINLAPAPAHDVATDWTPLNEVLENAFADDPEPFDDVLSRAYRAIATTYERNVARLFRGMHGKYGKALGRKFSEFYAKAEPQINLSKASEGDLVRNDGCTGPTGSPYGIICERKGIEWSGQDANSCVAMHTMIRTISGFTIRALRHIRRYRDDLRAVLEDEARKLQKQAATRFGEYPLEAVMDLAWRDLLHHTPAELAIPSDLDPIGVGTRAAQAEIEGQEEAIHLCFSFGRFCPGGLDLGVAIQLPANDAYLVLDGESIPIASRAEGLEIFARAVRPRVDDLQKRVFDFLEPLGASARKDAFASLLGSLARDKLRADRLRSKAETRGDSDRAARYASDLRKIGEEIGYVNRLRSRYVSQ